MIRVQKVNGIAFYFLALCCMCSAALPQHESFYQAFAAKELGGAKEVTTKDGTRCDIVTATHAIEVDFKAKWAEALGQSLNYAFQLNKEAGIVLIIEDSKDTKEALRLNSLIVNYKLPIKLWILDAEKMQLEGF